MIWSKPNRPLGALAATSAVVAAALVAIVWAAPEGTMARLCGGEFMPHGHCYFWRPEILWLNVGSDSIVALSYFAIPICLVTFTRRRRGLGFRRVFWLFTLFILFCGLTHLVEVYTVWNGAYWLSGSIKALTAIASAATALYLVFNLKTFLRIPLPEEMEAVEKRLSEREALFEAMLTGGLDAFLAVAVRERSTGSSPAIEIEQCNDNAAELVGIPVSSLHGMRLSEGLAIPPGKELEEIVRAAFRADEPASGELVYENELGKRWLNYRVVPAGERAALFLMDTTRERQAEEAQKETLQVRAEQARIERDISAARAQAAIGASAHGIAIFDATTGRMVQANRQLQRYFGYNEEELLGREIDLLFGESGSERERFREARAGAAIRLEGWRKDGSRFPIEARLRGFSTPEGAFEILSLLDITERVEARRALEESEQRFQQAVKGGSVGIWHWHDLERDEVWWSPMFYQLIGYSPEELRASLQSFRSILHPDDQERTFGAVQSSVDSGGSFSVDYRLKTKHRGWRWFYAAGSVSFDETKGKRVMVGSIQDIQTRKDAEEEVKAANRELELRNREMEEMAYAVSHDLKSPLVSIQGFVRLLLSGGFTVDAAVRELLQRVERSAIHMGDLINDLLEMSKIGHRVEEPERVDTGAVAGELARELSELARDKDCRIEIQGALPTLWLERTRFRQCLQNLIGNAVKYGAAKGRPSAVEIGCRRVGPWIDLFVQDEGPGIPADCRESVFKLFKRLDREQEGTGLGLAIVAKVMRAYGGRAFVDPASSTGACFVLRFPATLEHEHTPFEGPKVGEGSSGERATPAIVADSAPTKRAAPGNESFFRDFVYSAAHDLNSPLVTVRGHLDFLQERFGNELGPEAAALLRQSVEASARMSRYLETLVQYAETFLGQREREDFPLRELLDEVQDDFAEQVGRQGTEVVLREPLPEITADRGLLGHVFHNLFDNALRAMAGSERRRIEIACQESERYWEIAFSDSGSGIDPEDRGNVFNPFIRVHRDGHSSGGIGLAVCRKIVEAHGGAIWVDPDATEMTTLRFTLEKPT